MTPEQVRNLIDILNDAPCNEDYLGPHNQRAAELLIIFLAQRELERMEREQHAPSSLDSYFKAWTRTVHAPADQK